jgi:transcriptional regulator with XRE-family HTH domain
MAPNHMLSRARMRRGWSQSLMASKLETSSKNVSRWECGETFPSPYFRERLCQLFGLDAEALGLIPTLADNDGEGNYKGITEPLRAVPPFQFSETQELVGRDQLLQDLIHQLLPGNILTLTGLPGVGKTALLQKLTRHPQIQERFPDGIIQIGLGQTPDLSRCISWVAHLLGLSTFAQEQEASEVDRLHLLIQLLRETISTRHLLIVFDDVWTAESVLPFLVRSSSVAYAISTRLPKIALALEAQAPTVVPPLSFQASHQLLTTLVPRMETLNETRLRQAIVHSGGVPLAIMLIGKYLASQSYGGQLRRGERALNLLSDRAYRLYLSIPLSPGIHMDKAQRTSGL